MNIKLLKRRFSLLALLPFLFILSIFVFAKTENFKLSVISANVSGLPAFLSKYDRDVPKSQETLGKMLNESGYDIVCVQEDFQYHDILSTQMTMYPYHTYSTGGVPIGDGVNIFSKYPIYNVERITWDQYNGIFSDGMDGLTPKGFIKCTVEVNGVLIDIYNLHGDAYRTEKDQLAKKAQLFQLTEYIEKNSANRPIIITGDTNLTFHNDPLADMYGILIVENGFTDTWVKLKNGGNYMQGEDAQAVIDAWYEKFGGHDWGRWDSVERVLYKNGDGLKLEPIDFEYKIYTDDNSNIKALTDHRIMECTIAIDISEYEIPENFTLKEYLKPAFFMDAYRFTFMMFRFVSIALLGVVSIIANFISQNLLVSFMLTVAVLSGIFLILKAKQKKNRAR